MSRNYQSIPTGALVMIIWVMVYADIAMITYLWPGYRYLFQGWFS